MSLTPGQQVRVITDPTQVGTMTDQFSGPPGRQRVFVNFPGGLRLVLLASLEAVPTSVESAYDLILNGRFGHAKDLRGAITNYRLNGKLANLIYSLNTTNTDFYSYQFKPVLQFLDSPSNSILIADEVGLGKTIEAGLIWTELKARQDAKRLLVLCPAMLRHKWKQELKSRFGVNADIQDAKELLETLKNETQNQREGFAIICSMQGLRPSKNWDDDENPSKSNSAQLARFLNEAQDNLFDLVIIDEAHYLRNNKTQTYMGGKLIRQGTQNLVMLSATPFQTKSTDLFNLLNLLDESAYPYEFSFDRAVQANAPLVKLRDEILAGIATPDSFEECIAAAREFRLFENNQQLAYFANHIPSKADLSDHKIRSRLANQLDKINFLSKTITRTLKREVQVNRVERDVKIIRVELDESEKEFYDAVSDTIIQYCDGLDVAQAFLLTSPQRQMSSCIAASHEAWYQRGKNENPDNLAEIFDLEITCYESFGYESLEDTNEASSDLSNIETNSKKKSTHKNKVADVLVNDSEIKKFTSTKKSTQNIISQPTAPKNTHGILTVLGQVALNVANTKYLTIIDSKYKKLLSEITDYWKLNPNKKIVLFSFYKGTLHYLSKKLSLNGIDSIVLHGGMDKQEVLDAFKDPTGPQILLASEVASEGIDLQFCSILINYDLPWNPAKLEQRIGRIDRIGQEASAILILNFVYKNTVDDRIYTRLLERVKQSSRILGSMEQVLGEEIQKLTYELLTHKLTPEQEINRIERTHLVLANLEQQEETLELAATQLMAHGDFIQNKVKAANEQGRYIKGSDLKDYVKDYFDHQYEGSRLIKHSENESGKEFFHLQLSIAAKQDFTDFLSLKNLQGKTAIARQDPPLFLFENTVGNPLRGIERITQEHPLIQFISESLKQNQGEKLYYPTTALSVVEKGLGIPKGKYVYCIMRWSFSGSKLIEKLEYMLVNMTTKAIIDGEEAEHIINTAASSGKDWLAANNEVSCELAAKLQDLCLEKLEAQFIEEQIIFNREDSDRTRMQIQQLVYFYETKLKQEAETIEKIKASGSKKIQQTLRMRSGNKRLEKLKNSVDQKIEEIKYKSKTSFDEEPVSAGLIHVI